MSDGLASYLSLKQPTNKETESVDDKSQWIEARR